MRASTLRQLEDVLNKQFQFRYNEVSGQCQFRVRKSEEAFKPLHDFDLNSIYRFVTQSGINLKIGDLQNLLLSDFVKRHNPFTEYVKDLPTVSGQNNIEQLLSTIETENNELFKRCFIKWYVALVGSLVDENTINHTVLVLAGGQGIGKTTWLVNLLPKSLSEFVFSGTINPGNKDSEIQLSECGLIIMDELENLNKSEIGSLKEMITKSVIRIRRPYARNFESLIRRASFAGSVNKKQFLNDSTGNRRFLCFEAKSINYMNNVDMNLVFAEAYQLFKSGYQFWFTQEEQEYITQCNEAYQLSNAEEEALLDFYSPVSNNTECLFMSTTEIANELHNHVKIKVDTYSVRQLGSALNKHGFQRMSKGGRKVYALYEYTEAERKNRNKEYSKAKTMDEKELKLF